VHVVIPSTAARFIHDPLRPWRRPPREAVLGKSVVWHTIWSETYSNPRYAELVPRLHDLFFAPIRQRSGFLGRVDGGVWRRIRFVERRSLEWYWRRGVRLLLTPSPWQAPLFAGPVVVDLDDPSRTPSEQVALRAPNIEHVVVTTASIARYVRESNPRVEVTVVPQGVDVDRATRARHAEVRQNLLARLNLSNETVIVGYHAPIICLSTDPDHQGAAFQTFYIDVLLAAVQKLWSEDLPFLTLLVGKASRSVRRLAQLERRLVLNDYVDRYELFDWIGTFDVGAYPRTVDFHGRQSVKLLEYMASGSAIVAMSSSETHFVHDASIGFVAADVDEFAARLHTLIVDHDVRRAFGDRGSALAIGHDWKTLASRYDAILAGVIDPV
jgi:glycosyltransferase involved in cell wall biosynthesis